MYNQCSKFWWNEPFFEEKCFSHFWFRSKSKYQKNRKNKKITQRTVFVRLWQFLNDINISINGQENNFWNFVKKSGFFPKMRVMGTLVGIAHFSVWPPGQCAFYELRFGLSTPPPIRFPQIAKNWISRKSKMRKGCFRTFSDLWRHSYFFCVPYFEINLSH